MITKEQAEYLVCELVDAVLDEYGSRGDMTNGSNQIALKGAKDAVIAAFASAAEVATLRERAAIAAMQGILSCPADITVPGAKSQGIADQAIFHADQLLRELSARGEVQP